MFLSSYYLRAKLLRFKILAADRCGNASQNIFEVRTPLQDVVTFSGQIMGVLILIHNLQYVGVIRSQADFRNYQSVLQCLAMHHIAVHGATLHNFACTARKAIPCDAIHSLCLRALLSSNTERDDEMLEWRWQR